MPSKKWIVEIPGFVTPSANEYLRLHYRNRHKKCMGWDVLLRHYGHLAKVKKATGKRKVTVWRYGMRLLDEANLMTPIDKMLIDPMRNNIVKRMGGMSFNLAGLGWIVDDCPRYLELKVKQRKAPKDRIKMVIEIEDLS